MISVQMKSSPSETETRRRGLLIAATGGAGGKRTVWNASINAGDGTDEEVEAQSDIADDVDGVDAGVIV